MGRKSTASIGRYTYRASMYTILESGGLFAGATVICFGMDVSGSIGGIAGIWALAQLAVSVCSYLPPQYRQMLTSPHSVLLR